MLANDCLEKAIAKFPACDQVTELDGSELKTLYKVLGTIVDLTSLHDDSKVGFTAIGGVDAAVKSVENYSEVSRLAVICMLCDLQLDRLL